MKKIWQLLLQMGILFGLLIGMLLLGGVFEGGVSLPAGLCGLAVAVSALQVFFRALARCEAHTAVSRHGTRPARSARPEPSPGAAMRCPARPARRTDGLRVA